MDTSTTKRTSTCNTADENPFAIAAEIIATATGIMGLLSEGAAALGAKVQQHEQLLKDAKKGAFSLFNFFKSLPKDIGDIFKKVKRGELEIEFVHVGLEPLINEMDKATNRLASAFIIGALIVGSSIIVYTGVGPKLFDMPLFGFLGFFIAAIMGFILAISILRSGRL